MYDDFLEIFQHSFHKFVLKSAKRLGKLKSRQGRTYYKFLGVFEFQTADQVFDSHLDSDEFDRWVRGLDIYESNCFMRKFTRKIRGGGKASVKTFKLVFNIIPRNIVKAELDDIERKVRLYVIGYGI